MRTPPIQAMLLIALALLGCRDDPTGTPPKAAASSLMASQHEADDPPRFSDWSAPVNLGPVVNTSFIEQGPSISKNGLSLYFQCGNCPTNIGVADIYVSQRASVSDPWGPPQRLGSAINTTSNEQAPRLS